VERLAVCGSFEYLLRTLDLVVVIGDEENFLARVDNFLLAGYRSRLIRGLSSV
jgi:hypothetical protein